MSTQSTKKRTKRTKKLNVLFPKDLNITAVREAMFRYIQKHPENISPCTTTNHKKSVVKIEKILARKSASDTLQILGDLNKSYNGVNGVFFKLFFGAEDERFYEKNNSLHVEAEIYEKVINPLLFNYVTPHLIAFYGIVKLCSTNSIYDVLESSNDKERFYQYLNDMNEKRKYDVNSVYMLSLERSSGMTLSEANKKSIVKDWGAVLFQIVWTLVCFQEAGLMHNDLHAGNIFLTILKVPHTFTYYVSRKELYQITTDHFVQIYDFDHSAKVKQNTIYLPFEIKNTGIRCEKYCECNKYDEKFDITRIMHNLTNYQWDEGEDIDVLNVGKRTYFLSLTTKNGFSWNGIPCKDGKYIQPSDDEVFPLRKALSYCGYNYRKNGNAYTLDQVMSWNMRENMVVSALRSSWTNPSSPYSSTSK